MKTLVWNMKIADPVRAICWVIAIMAVVVGLYIVSPFLALTAPTAAAAVFETAASFIGLAILSAVSITSGVMIIYGLAYRRRTWLRRGLLLNFVLRVYTTIISLIVYGLASPWIPNVALAAIVIILYFAVRHSV